MSADAQFKQLVDRVLRCREAEDEAKADTKEVYAELKALGYDKTAAGALVAELRKKDKNPDQFEERNAILDLYRDAYERASHTHTGARTREADNSDDRSGGASGHQNRSAPAYGGKARQSESVEPRPVEQSGGESMQAVMASAPVIKDAPRSSEAIPDVEIPMFLRPKKALRPHCQNPDLCAGYGKEHCHPCKKAMAESEAA